MDKLWTGRFKKQIAEETNDFNSSIRIDSKMYKEDITGSKAHADMLFKTGIISQKESEEIITGLNSILADLESGKLAVDEEAEDIHTFIEQQLIFRIGETGKKLHTARSRNDQVALDTRLYLDKKTAEIIEKIKELIITLLSIAKDNKETIMPGYTHLQRAQPVTLAQHLMAYTAMFLRDADRLKDCRRRIAVNPLGSCALAGTTFPIDRFITTRELGLNEVSFNSIDGVSDRDFCIELASGLALVMTHLSRFCEEIIMWCSWEFKFVELDDAYSTGSSIMPQKKNPDIAELIRGKTGRVYGNLVALLTMMKGLPLAYNKDMQEDKENIFDSIDTVLVCIPIFESMIKTAVFNKDKMLSAAENGYINATDCADYLTKKGEAFRNAYKITGQLVAYCIEGKKSLNTLNIDEYKKFSPLFEDDIYEAIDMKNCALKRNSYGSAGDIQQQFETARKLLEEL